MLDRVIENEGEPDIVQISGGEPTLHPEFFAVLAAARRRPVKHLMVNTNGIRIAGSRRFAEQLAEFMPGFELYLQFDSLRREPYRILRGRDLLDVKLEAIERLNELGISTTLVTTLKRGVNDDELGAIVDFALAQRCIRGVTFQPIQDAGRNQGFDPISAPMMVLPLVSSSSASISTPSHWSGLAYSNMPSLEPSTAPASAPTATQR